MFDRDNSGHLSAMEVVEMMKALDVEVGNADELKKYFEVSYTRL